MPPSPPPARRLFLLGCVLLGLAALLLPGCGGEGAATAESTNAPQAKRQAEVKVPSAQPCPAQVDAFVKSLEAMRRQLAVGLSYDQYAARVRLLRHGYDALPVDRLTIACLKSTGTPAEAALNKYIDVANAWGKCLADSSCTTATIESVLQRKWRMASAFLSNAQRPRG